MVGGEAMKKIYTFAFAAAATLALVSCANETKPEFIRETEPATISMTFEGNEEAVAEDETKTYISNIKNGTIGWVNGDTEVTVLDTEGLNSSFTKTDDSADKKTRTFSGDITKGAGIKYVIVPKHTDASLSGDVISGVTIPSRQVINNDNSFGQTANLAVSKDAATLKNVCGYIRFSNPQDGHKTFTRKGTTTVYKETNIKSAKIEAVTAGENMTGTCTVDFSGDVPEIQAFTTGQNYVEGIFKHFTAAEDDQEHYMSCEYVLCVAPGTYHGIRVTITYVDNTTAIMETEKDLVIKRGQYTNIGNLDPAVLSQMKLKGTFASVSSSASDTAITGMNSVLVGDSTTPQRLLSANMSVVRVCTAPGKYSGTDYNIGDIAQPTLSTAKTPVKITNNNRQYVAWATHGINVNSSSSRHTGLGFNYYTAAWTPAGGPTFKSGEPDGKAWFKLPAIAGFKLTEATFTTRATKPSKDAPDVVLTICPEVDAETGAGLNPIWTAEKAAGAQNAELTTTEAGREYYICFDSGNCQGFDGPFEFIYSSTE